VHKTEYQNGHAGRTKRYPLCSMLSTLNSRSKEEFTGEDSQMGLWLLSLSDCLTYLEKVKLMSLSLSHACMHPFVIDLRIPCTVKPIYGTSHVKYSENSFTDYIPGTFRVFDRLTSRILARNFLCFLQVTIRTRRRANCSIA
jgi:hypothetical protein